MTEHTITENGTYAFVDPMILGEDKRVFSVRLACAVRDRTDGPVVVFSSGKEIYHGEEYGVTIFATGEIEVNRPESIH